MKFLPTSALALLIIAGCAGPPRPEPIEVNIPVAASCSAADAFKIPQWNVPQLTSQSSYTDKLKAVLADLELSRGYISELEAEKKACS